MSDLFIQRAVQNADAQGRFVSSSELKKLSQHISDAEDAEERKIVVNQITSNASAIVTNAARSLFAEQPQLIAPGGNAYTPRRMAACLNDLEIILRYITYAIFSGESKILEDRCLNELKETYLALGVPLNSSIIALQKTRDLTLEIVSKRHISEGLHNEVYSYFNMVITSLE